MKVTISPEITSCLQDFDVIAYTMDVDNQITDEVTKFIDATIKSCQDLYTLEEIIQEPMILSSRNGYKKLGKDPSHTRLACENLWRRMIKRQPFYRLGDLIDLGNILSIITKRSVCVVDLEKVQGDVLIRLGNENDHYETINRGILNVSKIPVYEDEVSPFGCPSSDTKRTSISKETKKILVMIICFSKDEMSYAEQQLIDIYQKYAGAKNIIKVR